MPHPGKTSEQVMLLLSRAAWPMDAKEIAAGVIRACEDKDLPIPAPDTVRHVIADLAGERLIIGERERGGRGQRKLWRLATLEEMHEPEIDMGRQAVPEPPPFVAPCTLAGLVQQQVGR